MLASEMFVQQLALDRAEVGRELQGHQSHVRDALDGDRSFDRLGDRHAPGERPVAIDQHARIMRRIKFAEPLGCKRLVVTRPVL